MADDDTISANLEKQKRNELTMTLNSLFRLAAEHRLHESRKAKKARKKLNGSGPKREPICYFQKKGRTHSMVINGIQVGRTVDEYVDIFSIKGWPTISKAIHKEVLLKVWEAGEKEGYAAAYKRLCILDLREGFSAKSTFAQEKQTVGLIVMPTVIQDAGRQNVELLAAVAL